MIDRQTHESRFTHAEWANACLPWLITYLEGSLDSILPNEYIGPTLRAIESDYKRTFRIK